MIDPTWLLAIIGIVSTIATGLAAFFGMRTAAKVQDAKHGALKEEVVRQRESLHELRGDVYGLGVRTAVLESRHSHADFAR